MNAFRIAVVQMNSGGDKEANLRAAEDLIDRAAAERPGLIVLPEYFNFLGLAEEKRANAEPVPGQTIDRLRRKALQHRIYLHCGSISETSPETPKLFNTNVILNPEGEIIARYRKIHLYDVEIPGQVSALESASIEAGTEVVNVEIEGVNFGLSICYDLRFPELYRILTLRGAHVLLVPAAFMMFTGKDHWELLLRARAVENQSYVVAAGQVGKHPPAVWCYGRSMIVDPWGTVLATAPDGPSVITADLDLDRLATIRRELPSVQNRRPSAYVWPEAVAAAGS
jgi:deaminated glutathione amidase